MLCYLNMWLAYISIQINVFRTCGTSSWQRSRFPCQSLGFSPFIVFRRHAWGAGMSDLVLCLELDIWGLNAFRAAATPLPFWQSLIHNFHSTFANYLWKFCASSLICNSIVDIHYSWHLLPSKFGTCQFGMFLEITSGTLLSLRWWRPRRFSRGGWKGGWFKRLWRTGKFMIWNSLLDAGQRETSSIF